MYPCFYYWGSTPSHTPLQLTRLWHICMYIYPIFQPLRVIHSENINSCCPVLASLGTLRNNVHNVRNTCIMLTLGQQCSVLWLHLITTALSHRLPTVQLGGLSSEGLLSSPPETRSAAEAGLKPRPAGGTSYASSRLGRLVTTLSGCPRCSSPWRTSLSPALPACIQHHPLLVTLPSILPVMVPHFSFHLVVKSP